MSRYKTCPDSRMPGARHPERSFRVILSEAKDLIQSPSHKNPARRANRVPVLTPNSPERDKLSVISYQLSVMSYERSARFSAPHQFTKLMEGKRGMTSLAPPGADEARRGMRRGRISRARARQRREDFFGNRKRGFNQVPRNFARRLAPHQLRLMEGVRGGQGEF